MTDTSGDALIVRPRTRPLAELTRRAHRQPRLAAYVVGVAVGAIPSGVLSRTVAGWVFATDTTAWRVTQSVLFGALLVVVQFSALPDGLYKTGSLGRPAPTPIRGPSDGGHDAQPPRAGD